MEIPWPLAWWRHLEVVLDASLREGRVRLVAVARKLQVMPFSWASGFPRAARRG